MWGEYGRSKKVWKEMWRNVLGCGEVWGEERGDVGEVREMWREVGKHGQRIPYPLLLPSLLPHSSTFSHISPTPLFTPSPTFFDSYPLTPSIFPPYLTQLLQLLKTPLLPHHPYSSKFFIIPYSSPYSFPAVLPLLLYHLPLTKTSHFSHLLSNLIQQSSALETPTKFHKKKFKNKNKKWQHSV